MFDAGCAHLTQQIYQFCLVTLDMPKMLIDDVELYYEQRGTGGLPIIFVHGFLASSKMWHDNYVAHLPSAFCAYTIDMRGHGQSRHFKRGCHVLNLVRFAHPARAGECWNAGTME